MRVAVLGASGVIGTTLLPELMREHDVVGHALSRHLRSRQETAEASPLDPCTGSDATPLFVVVASRHAGQGGVARPLVEGLRIPTVARENRVREFIPSS